MNTQFQYVLIVIQPIKATFTMILEFFAFPYFGPNFQMILQHSRALGHDPLAPNFE
jgi:hypothetical protein